MEFKTQKLTFKTYFSSFLIWSGIILGIIVIVSELILAMILHKNPTSAMANPADLWTPSGVWVGLWESLSTFSMQSMILVTIFFCLVLTNRIYPNRAKFVNGPFSLAITLYATITMIVFWTSLFKTTLEKLNSGDPVQITAFVYTFFLHLALPLIIIVYYLINAGTQKWAIKKTLALYFPLAISYMLVYLAYVLLKGTFVGVVKDSNGTSVIDYSYPYSFLNFKAHLNMFIIYFFAILLGFILLYIIYFLYNNWRNKKIVNKLNNLK